MERKPPSSIGDFFSVLKRRKYWLIVPFLVVAGLGILLTPLIPRSYQSTTTILVVPQKVPTDYVKPSTSAVMSRLNRIELEIMSGTGFRQIIDNLNLYPKQRQKENTPQLVAQMRKDISVDLVPDASDGRGNVGAFTISYIGPTPEKTQAATKQIAELFINENRKEGHQLAVGTDTFLTQQVNQAAQQLADQEQKIQAFKSAHLNSLPEETQANMSTVAQLQAEMTANGAAIDQDNQQRVYLQSVLNVNPASNSTDASPTAPTPLEMELAQKQSQLQTDLMKYTSEYPDVVRLQHEISALKFQIRHSPKSSSMASAVSMLPPTTGPSVNEQLRSQLVALNTDLRARKAHQEEIERQIRQLQGSVADLPAVQTEYAALDSDYQEMQKNYNALLEKQQEAGMAAQLDQSNDSEQFMVLDPASLPTVPYRPNPILLYMGAVFLGLLAGFLCALVVELRDDTIHDAEEAATYLKLPVMIGLPKCPPFSEEAWKIAGN